MPAPMITIRKGRTSLKSCIIALSVVWWPGGCFAPRAVDPRRGRSRSVSAACGGTAFLRFVRVSWENAVFDTDVACVSRLSLPRDWMLVRGMSCVVCTTAGRATVMIVVQGGQRIRVPDFVGYLGVLRSPSIIDTSLFIDVLLNSGR